MEQQQLHPLCLFAHLRWPWHFGFRKRVEYLSAEGAADKVVQDLHCELAPEAEGPAADLLRLQQVGAAHFLRPLLVNVLLFLASDV